MYCSKCGNLVDSNAKFCSKCDNFEEMFNTCKKLDDVSSIENWNIEVGKNTTGMFYKAKTQPKWYIE